MSDFFYNTISLAGDKLVVANAKAMYQADLILEIYKANPDKLISPSQILYIVKRKYGLHWPIIPAGGPIKHIPGVNSPKPPIKPS